jgi:hypothetical protein
MTQVAECLPSMHEALSSTPDTPKSDKKKKKKGVNLITQMAAK